MTNVDGTQAQAVEWMPGMPVSTGTYPANLLHCVEDGDVVAHFQNGNETRAFKAGDDFSIGNVKVTISSGKFDIN